MIRNHLSLGLARWEIWATAFARVDDISNGCKNTFFVISTKGSAFSPARPPKAASRADFSGLEYLSFHQHKTQANFSAVNNDSPILFSGMADTNQVLRNPKTGQSIRFVSTGRDTAGQLLHMEATYRAYSTEPAAHCHPHQVEDFTVLAGELTVQIHGQRRTLRPGDTLHLPQNTVHSMWNASDAETRLDWQVRPPARA